jgi:WD40 repeat protein
MPDDVKIWNGVTGELLAPSAGNLSPVIFTPDHKLLAFLKGDYDIVLWSDHQLGILSYKHAGKHETEYNPVFSPDGHSIAASTWGEGVIVWDVDSTTTLPTEPRLILAANYDVYEPLFSPDGQIIAATGQMGGMVYLWDTKTGNTYQTLDETGFVSNTQFSPDGKLLLTRLYEDDLLLWHVATGEKWMTMPGDAVLDTTWSHAAYWKDGNIHISNLSTRSDVKLTAIAPYLGKILAFSPVADLAVFGGDTADGYSLQTGRQLFTLPISYLPKVIEFSEDGRLFMSLTRPADFQPSPIGSEPLSIDVWNTATPTKPLSSIDIPFSSDSHYQIAPRGQFILEDVEEDADAPFSYTNLWNARSGEKVISNWDFAGDLFAWTPDAKILAARNPSGLQIYDLAATIQQAKDSGDYVDAVVIATVNLESDSGIGQIVFSADGARMAVQIFTYATSPSGVEATSTIYLFDVHSLTAQGENFETSLDDAASAKISGARAIHFSSHGNLLLTQDGLYDSRTGEKLVTIPTIDGAAFSPDDSIIATYNNSGIALWDVAALIKGKQTLLTTLQNPEQNTQEVAFSSDGKLLFMRNDSRISIWGVGSG